MARDEYDALTLALAGEPLPEDSARDPELVAEHAAAVADVALLREHIGAVGRALAAPEPEPEPEPVAVPKPVAGVRPAGVRPAGVRRRLTLALGVAAATAAVSLVGGLAWLAVESGGGITESSDSDAAKGAAPGDEKENGGGAAEDLSPEGYVACARLIVEGTVNRVEPIPGAEQERIVLDVSRYYKPVSGKKQITFVMDVDVDPPLRPGDRTLIGIDRGDASPTVWSTGKAVAKDRAWIERALPRAKGLTC
ncbi:hypothetical protein [Streptomyces sp. NPDC047525]|uniref:hypothetical protein n=1 Tax=Streptomyces sp. NPDC047525 TaxID=3155264 RepID=UPI00340A7890